jgi:hypothetical protein
MRKRLRVPVALGLGLFAALVAAAALSRAAVSFRSAEQDGERVAEVLIGERVVIVLRREAGGHTPLERAGVVAGRLRAAMGGKFTADDIEVSPITSGHAVFIEERLIVSVYGRDGDAQHASSSDALARLWRSNIAAALGLERPEALSDEKRPASQDRLGQGRPGPLGDVPGAGEEDWGYDAGEP